MGKIIDLTGQRFGRLTVIERAENYVSPKGHEEVQWRCICDCGKESITRGAYLKSGKAKSCGCLKVYHDDFTGRRFGRLTVIERVENYVTPKGKIKSMWGCHCDCGNVKIVTRSALTSGHVKSCGCLSTEMRREIRTSHGKSGTRLYRIWAGMKARCAYPKNISYPRYGGRGITVCDEWLHNFQAFYDWAMANGYRDDLSIDRIDADGNYCPENCRWATPKEQNRNTRSNRYITINGETECLAEWCEKYKIPMVMVWKRLKHGWSIEEALGIVARKK